MNGLTSTMPLDPNVAQVLRGFEARLQHIEHRVHSLEIGDAHGTKLIQSIYDDLVIEDKKEVYHTPAPSPALALNKEEPAPTLLSPPPQLNAFLPPLPPFFLLSSPSSVKVGYSRAEIVRIGQQVISSGFKGSVKKLQHAVVPADVESPPKQASLNISIDNTNRSSSPEWERSVGRSKSFDRSHSNSQDSGTFQNSLREYQHQQKRLASNNAQGSGAGGGGGQQQSRQASRQQQQKRGGHHHRTVTRTSNTATKAKSDMDTVAKDSHHSELRFGMLVQVPDSDSETP